MTDAELPDDAPAEYDGWRPGCFLVDHDADVLVRLPLGAWEQLRQWHRDPNARPLLLRDPISGQITSIDRRLVVRIDRRDLDACVVLESVSRDNAAMWAEDDE